MIRRHLPESPHLECDIESNESKNVSLWPDTFFRRLLVFIVFIASVSLHLLRWSLFIRCHDEYAFYFTFYLATVLIVLIPSSLLTLQVEAPSRRIQEFDHSVDSVVRTTKGEFVRSFVRLFCSICFFNHLCLTILFYTALLLQIEESDSIRSKNPQVEEFDHSVDSVVMRTTR